MARSAQSKSPARAKIPAVIHADGTGRIQIVRAEDDPLTYAYLKALGRHIGVEVSVNTSFNVAGPIAQSASRAIDTLRRSRGLDVVLLVASDGAAYAAWHGGKSRQRPLYGLALGMADRIGGPVMICARRE
jgi:carbamoyltransferase